MLSANTPNSLSGTRVYFTDPGLVTDSALIAELTSWLDAHERARMQRFVHAHDQHLFLISHALTRKTLGQIMHLHPRKLVFQRTDRGKPLLDPVKHPSAPQFNLTHTAGLAAIAISHSDVGVDAETVLRNGTEMDVASRFFSRHEVQDIAARPLAEHARRFLTYWTLKEAFLKAEGWGLVDDLDQFEFHIEESNALLRVAIALHVKHPKMMPTRPWQFWTTSIGESHILSAACCHLPDSDCRLSSMSDVFICHSVDHGDWTR